MSVTLTISPDAVFPDRGSAGLRVAMQQGNDGAYLTHAFDDDLPCIHVRLLLAPATAAGGAVNIAGGHDATGQPTWWLDYNADTRELRLELATGEHAVTVLNALPWQCVELRVDTIAGEATLWLNGVERGAVQGSLEDLASRSTWLGAVFKDTALAGELHIDEWAIAEAAIGPVKVAPADEHANDPVRWLVVYNAASSDSVTWAEAYRQARGVPFANLLGLDLPTEELIDAAQYAALAEAVNAYLADTGLDEQVMGVLLGYRVPGYVDFAGDQQLDAVPALMHHPSTIAGISGNPIAVDAAPTRPTRDDMGPRRMTARIDGRDLAAALALTDRADAHIEHGLGDGELARLWLDPFAGAGSVYQHRTPQMVAWSASLDRMRTRLPLKLSSESTDPEQSPAGFASIHRDAFFWGWPAGEPAVPPPGFFGDPAGRRACCVQLDLVGPTATTLRSGEASNWIEAAIGAGYAAAVAAARVHSGSATPYVRPFMDALRRGWTLAEAWYVALPVLREGLYLVGDPLLRTQFPQAGWDVFGPVDRLEQLDADAPDRVLPAAQTQLPLEGELQPVEGAEATYMVRRVDEQGRREASASPIRVQMVEGALQPPPVPPVWPGGEDWRARVEEGELVLTLIWERPMRSCRVKTITLLAELDGEPEVVVYQAGVSGGAGLDAIGAYARHVVVRQSLPAVQARYRWRLMSPAGATHDGPWSAVVRPTMVVGHPLHLLEVRP